MERSLLRRVVRPMLRRGLRARARFGDKLASWRGELQAEMVRLEAEQASIAPIVVPPATETGPGLIELPIELLFTEGSRFADTPNQTPAWLAHRAVWADLPLARLRPHLALYDYFLQRGPFPDAYIAWHESLSTTRGLVAETIEALMNRRYREFLAMEERLLAGTFGSELPVKVDYNPGGYFNIRDGHHRAAYLLRRGWRRVPVQLDVADRERWAPAARQQAVLAEIERTGRDEFYTPILAPLFYGRTSLRDASGPTRLETILRYLGPTRLANRRVLDIGSNLGFYAQHFAREGAIVTGIEPDPKHAGLARLLNDLFGVSYELREERFEDCKLPPHDVGVMLTVFYHFAVEPQLRARFLEKIRSTVKEMLFWESGGDPEVEKRYLFEGTHFKRYEKLGDTFGTGKSRELGVFLAS